MWPSASEIELGPAEPVVSWLDYRKLSRRLASLSPEQVAADQRWRIFAALPDALVEHGYNGPAVAEMLRSAHISRKTFYELFDGKDEALMRCRDDAFQVLRRELDGARAGVGRRPGAVARGLDAVLRLAAEDPPRARLLLADPWVTGPRAAEGWEAALGFLSLLLGRRRGAHISIREEGLLGGARHLVLSRIYAGRADALPALAAPLGDLILATGPRRRRA